ncbi:MAG: hypothetical protein AB1480_08515 [Nitrospirota bacterium]
MLSLEIDNRKPKGGENSFDNFEVEHDFPDIGPRKMLLNARRIIQENGGNLMILLAIEDITGK